MILRERIFRVGEEENRRVILETASPRPGAWLIDLGCGDGAFTVQLAERVGAVEVHGAELVDDLAAAAEARGVRVALADLGERLPFDDASFDVIHSNQVIEHLPRTDHFMAEVRRLLRPDGYAVISTNNLSSWHNIVSLVLGLQPPPCHVSDDVIVGNPANYMDGAVGARGQMHLRVFTGSALAALGAHHGLHAEVRRGAGYYPFPEAASRAAARLDPRHAAFLVQRFVIAR
jgi:SAM-dependent methyltransferase